MKNLLDIHNYLVVAEDMLAWPEQEQQAAEKMNHLLHMVFDALADDIDADLANQAINHVWQVWNQDQYLLELDESDMLTWVDDFIEQVTLAGESDDEEEI